MSSPSMPEHCPDCAALGAELCPECAARVVQLHDFPGREVRPAGPRLPDTDLTLRQASVVLAHVRRFAPDAYSDALAYAADYLAAQPDRPALRRS